MLGMNEVEMMAKDFASSVPLPCPLCDQEVNVLWILSIWWDKGVCEECCYKIADRGGVKIIGDQRE